MTVSPAMSFDLPITERRSARPHENASDRNARRNAHSADAGDAAVYRGGLTTWQRRRVVSYVEENLSRSIRIEEMASLARLSKSHFSRAFRESFGDSPYNYVLVRRVARAKELMIATRAPLSEIALDCGMCDQAHFCRVFKRAVGTSPDRWRRPNMPEQRTAMHQE
ncbi:helix-turn-helix domain-containing protein [Martelella radicis]|uniref:AraC-like DNA-binding protein n=1 Tax=Martelella radicis TaxID=1397476 RepID=A0A7W6P8B0_9HYPH|nr:AraC family transcriptional regulator [Martelella radicis]MBB4120161.1 AraC-like DNA-binding protein [Martelella radicis]